MNICYGHGTVLDIEDALINKTKSLELVVGCSHEWILNTYYVPGTFLGTKDVIMNKADKNPYLRGENDR